MEMRFEDLAEKDQILIRTRNSEYRFSVTDPAERRGTLSGGSLGSHQRDAVLVGTLESDNQLNSDTSGLKTGRRALFFLKARHGIERLITSIITDVTRNRTSESGKRAA